MKRREVSEIIFNYIKSIGFKPYDIQYGDGYFIFDKGEDGVIHFKIKGLFGWKFAMWINTNENELKNTEGEEYPALQIFTQHIDNIDKFKPSRSYFVEKYNLKELENPEKYQWYRIAGILKMIKKHPLIAYYCDQCEYFDYVSKSFILNYIHSKLDKRYRAIRDYIKEWLPILWIKFKLIFCGKNKIIKEVNIIDRNQGGWKTCPRWNVNILFKENSNDELECKFLNKWFIKMEYSEASIILNRVGIDYPYSYE